MSDVDDMTGAKVGFRDLEGFERTAYIETDHGTYGFGTLKHSESAVWIRWGEPHREIPPVEAHATELREQRAEAWSEGYEQGSDDEKWVPGNYTDNPYRSTP